MSEHIEEALLDIACGRCGTPLKVRIADLGDARFVECEAKPPFNKGDMFVVFEPPRIGRSRT